MASVARVKMSLLYTKLSVYRIVLSRIEPRGGAPTFQLSSSSLELENLHWKSHWPLKRHFSSYNREV